MLLQLGTNQDSEDTQYCILSGLLRDGIQQGPLWHNLTGAVLHGNGSTAVSIAMSITLQSVISKTVLADMQIVALGCLSCVLLLDMRAVPTGVLSNVAAW